MLSIDAVKRKVERLRYAFDSTKQKLKALEDRKRELEHEIDLYQNAIAVLTDVLMISQSNVISFIEEVVGSGLQGVYSSEYKFKVEYALGRNQPEMKLLPMKNEMIYNPKFSCGIGVVDVCSFLLRYACWALMEPRPAAVMFHDEPFRHVHGEKENQLLALLLQRISEMLNIQVIVVSGNNVLADYVDKCFVVSIDDGVSRVRENKGG